jgi:hypothetical protein
MQELAERLDCSNADIPEMDDSEGFEGGAGA